MANCVKALISGWWGTKTSSTTQIQTLDFFGQSTKNVGSQAVADWRFLDIGYDSNNLFMASYDWRLSFKGLEQRDKYFTKLKNMIELAHTSNDKRYRGDLQTNLH